MGSGASLFANSFVWTQITPVCERASSRLASALEQVATLQGKLAASSSDFSLVAYCYAVPNKISGPVRSIRSVTDSVLT